MTVLLFAIALLVIVGLVIRDTRQSKRLARALDYSNTRTREAYQNGIEAGTTQARLEGAYNRLPVDDQRIARLDFAYVNLRTPTSPTRPQRAGFARMADSEGIPAAMFDSWANTKEWD